MAKEKEYGYVVLTDEDDFPLCKNLEEAKQVAQKIAELRAVKGDDIVITIYRAICEVDIEVKTEVKVTFIKA